MELVYNSTLNRIGDHSQILNLESRSMAVFERHTITVEKVKEIDYYTCSRQFDSGSYVFDESALTRRLLWQTSIAAAAFFAPRLLGSP
ncbi:hypothetical protein EGR_01986 [Echinococcus granulosus]|uniref:Uncharacterized protein n=1 Tax=Echinococcus granulosus TaxID=6210 RepID=W6UXB4_ECHGR|nr:hypothetical protein EGR_01986 [Echinococcus granulosus]EUB63182.1 hypothetical protein EGR_01986 [Echinococcus granulosus]